MLTYFLTKHTCSLIYLDTDSLQEHLMPHLFCLVDAADRRHLTVFVDSKNLTHGTRGHTVGCAEDVDLLSLVNVAHGCLFLLLWRWLAAVEV